MDRSRIHQQREALWSAALREAAGPLAAYITPPSFSLENVSVRLLLDEEVTDFTSEIEARLDLGRADAFLRILEDSQLDLVSAYQHVLSWSEGVIRGKVHIPRYVLANTRKEKRGVPVVVARRQVTTPENLLIAEGLRICTAIAAQWRRRGGAEAQIAERLLNELQAHEGNSPWNELRTKARPSLADLVGIVIGRVQTGEIEVESLYHKAALLFARRPENATAFERAASWIALMITQSPEFEDRVFELLCLSWMISVFQACLSDVSVRPDVLRGRRNVPVATGTIGSYRLSLFFQQSAGVLPNVLWADRHTHRPFRAIPDIVLQISDAWTNRVLVIDAKNRSVSSESEVAYKLMGYKENLGIEPFYGIAMYPSFSNQLRLRRLRKTQAPDEILLAHVPLANGKQIVGQFARRLLHILPALPFENVQS